VTAALRIDRAANPYLDIARAERFGDYGNPVSSRWSEEITRAVREKRDRRSLCRRFAFAIPDEWAIGVCVKHGPIVEMGAGTGYWASLIAASGGDVIAYDDRSWELESTYFDVRRGTPEDLANHTDRTLLLCWPPMDEMCERALDHYRGERVIYVGEGVGGCTGTDAFHERLGAGFEKIDGCSIPQWDGIHDRLSVWRRR
jgi:hypothetical protein